VSNAISEIITEILDEVCSGGHTEVERISTPPITIANCTITSDTILLAYPTFDP
jgi:hypothetical protein